MCAAADAAIVITILTLLVSRSNSTTGIRQLARHHLEARKEHEKKGEAAHDFEPAAHALSIPLTSPPESKVQEENRK